MFGRRFNTEAYQTTELFDLLGTTLFTTVKQKLSGSISDRDLEFLIRPLPESSKTAETLEYNLNRLEELINNRKGNYKHELKMLQDFNPLGGGTIADTLPKQGQTANAPQKTVLMKTPDNGTIKGTIIPVALENVEAALKKKLTKVN